MKQTPGGTRKFVIYKVFGMWQVLAPSYSNPSVKHFRSYADAVASIPRWFEDNE